MAQRKDDDRGTDTKGSGNFKDDPERAAEAGRKGGQASQGGRGKDEGARKQSGKDDR
jgi:hypothetical protein